ncbi:methyl-accepting chemotaxis protein [Pseudanabaena biceps]|nr:methyl-accepting chemotaxis protein [Pseudanabaena biceps]
MASTKQNRATSLSKGKQTSPARSPNAQKNNPKSGKSKSSMGLGLILIAICTSLIGLGGLGYFLYQELVNGAKREAESLAVVKSSQLESKLSNVRQSVDTVIVQAKSLPKPRTAASYQKTLGATLQSAETIVGMGIVANGNALIPSAKSFSAYVFKEKSGLIADKTSQKIPELNDGLLASNRGDLQSLSWLPESLKGNSSFSDVYSALGQSVITYSAPISEGDKVVGVVSADILAANLLPASSEEKIGFVVLNASGKAIAKSSNFDTAQSQNPAIADALKSLVQTSTAQPTGVLQTGGNLWAYRKIAGSNWLVATYLPESEIIAKLAILVGGAAIGISTILAIAIFAFVNALKKRLQPITEECERFLAQQGNSDLSSSGDEIDQLSASLKTTLQQVKNNELRLRNELTHKSATGDLSSAQIQQSFAENELIEAEVGDLLDVVSSMEEGDLTIEAQVNDRATGLVADTLNRLREKLVEIISSVLGTAQEVAKGAFDLEELARTVVLNTAEQAQSVAQGQALTEQVAMIAERSASQVSVANQSLQEVRDTVASGQTAIDTLTESISVLQTGSAQIVQRIKTLGEFVGLAEQFVQDQGQIASLTQVLALNATLVAARAAEQKDPKQFASVAREFESIAGQVNDLATQTNDGLTILQQRTSQIQTVVTAIDAEVQNLSGLVSGFTIGVESSQAAFSSIQSATEEVVQIGQTITTSSTEIAEAAGSTATYISEIAQLADRTANLTRSARQQAEEMGNQAQQLLQGIQFFRLPETTPVTAQMSSSDQDTSEEALGMISAPLDPVTAKPIQIEDQYSDQDNTGFNLVMPTLAVVAASTAYAVSQSGSSETSPEQEFSETETISESSINEFADISNAVLPFPIEFDVNDLEDPMKFDEILDDIDAMDDEYLTEENSNALDVFASVDSEDLGGLDILSPQESQNAFAESAQFDYELTEPAMEVDSFVTPDISTIEESLLADLRQEIYEDDELDTDYLTEDEGVYNFGESLDVAETVPTLKNSLDGVDETAIFEASSDPQIVSATSSFLEDTAFGTATPLSEESLAHLPTSVDFNIPDLDSDDFEIPRTPIESSLDDSSSFFDAPIVTQPEISLPDVDFSTDYANESIAEVDYVIDEEMFTLPLQDENLDISIADEMLSDSAEDYSSYVSGQDFNESLDNTFGITANDDFGGTFDVSFDESPFDRALDEALNGSQDDFGLSYGATEQGYEEISEESSEYEFLEQSIELQVESNLYQEPDAVFDIPNSSELNTFEDQTEHLSLDNLNEPLDESLEEPLFDDSEHLSLGLYESFALTDDIVSTNPPDFTQSDRFFEPVQSEDTQEFIDPFIDPFSGYTDSSDDSLPSLEAAIASEIDASESDGFSIGVALDSSEDSEQTFFPSLLDEDDFGGEFDEELEDDLGDRIEVITDAEIEIAEADDLVWQVEKEPTNELVTTNLEAEFPQEQIAEISELDQPTSDPFESPNNPDWSETDDEIMDQMFSFATSEAITPNEEPNFEFEDSIDTPEIVPNSIDVTEEDLSIQQIDPELEPRDEMGDFGAISDSPIFASAAEEDHEESTIFGIAPSYLDEQDSQDEYIVNDLADNLAGNTEEPSFEASFDFEQPLSAETSTTSMDEFSTDWLGEIIEEKDSDEVFGDLLIEYPSLDQTDLGISPEPSYDFADSLLDSLMSESEQDFDDFDMNTSDLLEAPDLSNETSLDALLDGSNSTEETLDSDADDDSEFDFDFSAFDGLDDSIGEPKDDKDKDKATSQEAIEAKSEIDDFLSNTLGIE